MGLKIQRKLSFATEMGLMVYSTILWIITPLAWVTLRLWPEEKHQLKDRQLDDHQLNLWRQKRQGRKHAILFYLSSAGEYEQAKPLLDRCSADPTIYVAILFHSRSGYIHASALSEAIDFMMAPVDRPFNWRRLFEAIDPSITVLVRNEFWPNFMAMAYKKSYLIAVELTHSKCSPLNLYVKKRLLRLTDARYAACPRAKDLYHAMKLQPINMVGETKYDRTVERLANQRLAITSLSNKIRNHAGDPWRLVIGSAWDPDIHLALDALPALTKTMKGRPVQILIVPHRPTPRKIRQIEAFCERRYLTHATINRHRLANAIKRDVLIVDEVGYLFHYYACANLCFVGGGFVRERVHNLLEAAIHLKPICMGPRIDLQTEAFPLIKAGLARIIKTKEDLTALASSFKEWQETCEEVGPDFIKKNSGASDLIFRDMQTALRHRGIAPQARPTESHPHHQYQSPQSSTMG